MAESISKFVSYFVFAFTYAVIAIIIVFLGEGITENYVTDATVKFVNECQTTGRIDVTNMSRYTKKIYGLGYDIEMTVEEIRSILTGCNW